jgi:hypothetical protein
MRFIVLALFAAIFFSVSATPEIKTKALPADVLAFLEGFALGVEAQIGNITACTADVEITLEDFNLAYKQITQGFRDWSPKLVEQGFVSFGHGIEEIAVAFKDCGVDRLVNDLEKLAAELKTGTTGIIHVIYKEIINIFTHGKEITNDVKNFLKYWQAKQYELAGVQAGKIVAILLEPETKQN